MTTKNKEGGYGGGGVKVWMERRDGGQFLCRPVHNFFFSPAAGERAREGWWEVGGLAGPEGLWHTLEAGRVVQACEFFSTFFAPPIGTGNHSRLIAANQGCALNQKGPRPRAVSRPGCHSTRANQALDISDAFAPASQAFFFVPVAPRVWPGLEDRWLWERDRGEKIWHCSVWRHPPVKVACAAVVKAN